MKTYTALTSKSYNIYIQFFTFLATFKNEILVRSFFSPLLILIA